VILVHDIEMRLEKLGRWEKKLIAMVVIEEFSQEEAARLLQGSERAVRRYIYKASVEENLPPRFHFGTAGDPSFPQSGNSLSRG